MKKVLLIGLILAILLLAFPQGVMADAIQTKTIYANYGSATEFTVDLSTVSGYWPWDLVANKPDQNLKPDALLFHVNSQSRWDITAYDDNGKESLGYMWGDQGRLNNRFGMTTGNPKGSVFGNLGSSAGLYIAGAEASSGDKEWTEDINQPVDDNDKGSYNPFATTIKFECVAAF